MGTGFTSHNRTAVRFYSPALLRIRETSGAVRSGP